MQYSGYALQVTGYMIGQIPTIVSETLVVSLCLAMRISTLKYVITAYFQIHCQSELESHHVPRCSFWQQH